MALNPSAYRKLRNCLRDPKGPLKKFAREAMDQAGVDLPINIRWRHKGHHTSGQCTEDNIAVTIPVDASDAEWQAVILHEVAHAATWEQADHGQEWQKEYVRLARWAGAEGPLEWSNVRGLDSAIEMALGLRDFLKERE